MFSVLAAEWNHLGSFDNFHCFVSPWGKFDLTSHGVAKSPTRLSNFTFTFHFHALEKEMATHSSVPAWRIPGTGEPGWLPSMGSHRVRHDWSNLAAAAAVMGSLRVGHDWADSLSLFTFMYWRRKWQPTAVFLPGESQGRGAWWAAVYGITQSQTWLKWLSSSSSSSLKYIAREFLKDSLWF